MRDSKRIDKVLGRVKEVWDKYPDLRLGQLICNVVGGEFKDIFYIEDEKLLEELEELEDYLDQMDKE